MSRRTYGRLLSAALLPVLLMISGRSSTGQAPAAEITEVHPGTMTPHYYDGKWALSPDGKTLALPRRGFIGNSPEMKRGLPPRKRGIELWDLAEGKSRMLWDAPDDVLGAYAAEFSKSGRALAVSHSRGCTIWSLHDGKEAVLILNKGGVLDMTFSDADRTLIGRDLVPTDDSTPFPSHRSVIIRWDIASGKQSSTADFRVGQLFKAISPDGRFGVFDDFLEQGVRVYDLTTRARKFELPRFGSFMFSDDGETIVSFARNGLSNFEVPSGKVLKSPDVIPLPGTNNEFILSISSRAKLLAAGLYPESHLAGLVSLESGKLLGTVECGPKLAICNKVQLSADGRTLVTSTYPVNRHDQPILPWLKIWRLPERW
jgi:hypothetical protein